MALAIVRRIVEHDHAPAGRQFTEQNA